MKHILLLTFCTIYLTTIQAQTACETPYYSDEIGLKVCHPGDWVFEKEAPYLKILTPMVSSVFNVKREMTFLNHNVDSMLTDALNGYREVWNDLEETKREKVMLDGREGTLLIAAAPGKSKQIYIYIVLFNDYAYRITHNCFVNCEKATNAIKSVIARLQFLELDDTQLKLPQQALAHKARFDQLFLEALQTESVEKFMRLQPTKSELENVLIKGFKNEEVQQQMLKRLNDNFEQFEAEFMGKNRKKFERILAEGRDKGIHWDQVTHLKSEYTLKQEIPGTVSIAYEMQLMHQSTPFNINIRLIDYNEERWWITMMGHLYFPDTDVAPEIKDGSAPGIEDGEDVSAPDLGTPDDQ